MQGALETDSYPCANAQATLQLDNGEGARRDVVADPTSGGTFPLVVSKHGVQIDMVKAEASRPQDKRAILHFVAGTVGGQRGEEPPQTHKNYDKLNTAARKLFAPGALRAQTITRTQTEAMQTRTRSKI